MLGAYALTQNLIIGWFQGKWKSEQEPWEGDQSWQTRFMKILGTL